MAPKLAFLLFLTLPLLACCCIGQITNAFFGFVLQAAYVTPPPQPAPKTYSTPPPPAPKKYSPPPPPAPKTYSPPVPAKPKTYSPPVKSYTAPIPIPSAPPVKPLKPPGKVYTAPKTPAPRLGRPPVAPYPAKAPPPPVVKPPPTPTPYYGQGPPVKKQECGALCEKRCVLHSRNSVCMRACTTCCARCKCVPPGTYGNTNVCGRCYTEMKTHGGRPKCP